MGQAATRDRFSRALASFLPLTALSLCAAACNNTCVFGALNSPGSTVTVKIGNPPPACNLTATNGAVHLEIGTSEPAGSGAASPQIAHLYVTLAGIDAHPNSDADDHSPDWQPLAPQLDAHPLQVDLLAPRGAEGAPRAFQEAFLPAGVYRRLRLRLAMPPASPESSLATNDNESVHEANLCGSGLLHCSVTSDGRTQPLAFASEFDLRIPPESMGVRWLHVLPDSTVTVRIDFDRNRSFLWSSGYAFHLLPEFHISIQPFSPVSPNSQN